MNEMKTFTAGGKTYEVVDAKARKYISELSGALEATDSRLSGAIAATETKFENELAMTDSRLSGAIGELSQSYLATVGTVEEIKKQVDYNERSLSALWKINEGQTYDLEQIEETGMNIPPSGSVFVTPEEIRGKTEQKSTNGYQLLDYGKVTLPKVVNGITFDKNPDGSFHIYGTNSSASSAYLTLVRNNGFVINDGETYTLSVKSDNTSHLRVQWFGYQANRSIQLFGVNGSNSAQFVDTNQVTNVAIGCDGNASIDCNAFIMFESGSVAHDWEPYTGGIPSPSPDYPQEIHSITALNVVTFSDSNNGGYPTYEPATRSSKTIIPPRPLNVTGEYRDVCDVVEGAWKYAVHSKLLSKSGWEDASLTDTYVEIRRFDELYGNPPAQNLVCTHLNDRDDSRVSNDGNNLWLRIPIEKAKTYEEARAFVENTDIYVMWYGETETLPVNASDLEFLHSLDLTPASGRIIVSDQDGNPVPWLAEYIIKLAEVNANG